MESNNKKFPEAALAQKKTPTVGAQNPLLTVISKILEINVKS